MRIRDIDRLSLSPDGSRFAILVRQADPAANDYRTAWFVGSTTNDALTNVGDGGEARLRVFPNGSVVGDIAGSEGRWSPDGKWLAYMRKHDGQVQLWRSRIDGTLLQQVSHNAADVRDFAWSNDGRSLYFMAGSSRADLHARDEIGRRNGFRFDEFQRISEIVYKATPARPLETVLTVWVVDADGGRESHATPVQRDEFRRLQEHGYRQLAGGIEQRADISASAAPPVVRADGARVWLVRVNAGDKGPMPMVRLVASLSPDGSNATTCMAPECTGQTFPHVWWTNDGRILFWRKEGVNQTEDAFYTWVPLTGVVTALRRSSDDKFRDCELGGARLICLRETLTQPCHVAAIDPSSGSVTVLADVNPEFRNIRFGAIERFEWRLPKDGAGLGYPDRAFGYILYPPDFDAHRKYPVIISPYSAVGFKRGDVGDEQPLLVYAASGFVVINSEFPFFLDLFAREAQYLTKAYSAELGFPHLTMLTESTFRGLDAVVARGFVDESRVGVGGLSQGAMTALFMLQKHDRLTAVSVAGPGWTQETYYFFTSLGRRLTSNWGPWPEDADYWSRIDIADHVGTIEAPVLFHLADREALVLARLMRRLDDAQKPYEAYIFPDEHHIKWQPAHRYAIYRRNLDWFRFWLQDYEDPSPEKAEQYARWRKLRELQCKNPRSLRDYCGMAH